MAEQLNPINSLSNNNVTTLVALANTIVNTMATTMVTANGSANGALTNGNGYVSGIFGASILTTGMLRGGSVQTPADLLVSSNTYINGYSLSISNGTSNTATLNASALVVPMANVVNAEIQYFTQSNLSFANCNITEVDLTTTGVAAVNLDSWAIGSYRSAEYVIQVTDNAANNHQVSKLIVTHDGSNALWDEYALLTTNGTIMTFSGVTNSTTLSIQGTPSSSNTTVRAVRTTINS